jgi:multiple sugar transport system permease protein
MDFTRVDQTATPDAVAPAAATVPAPARQRPFTVRRLTPYGYLSPTMVLILVLMVIPIAMVVSYSFKDNAIVEQNPVFNGLANYGKVLTDVNFHAALKNTFIFITLSTAAHLVLGLAFAMLLNTPLLSGATKAFFRIVFILPWLFTIAVIAVIWRLLLDPAGVVNYVLTTVGALAHGVNWLSSPNSALWALTFINIWSGYPFFMISLLAGLQGISLDLIWTSQQFALIWMTTGGGPLNVTEMLSTYTYKQAFSSYEFSVASASAVIVLLLTMVLAFFYVRSQRER